MQNFTCSWDHNVITTTIIALLIILVISVTLIIIAVKLKKKSKIFLLICVVITILLWTFPLVSLFQMPMQISLNNENIVIKRMNRDLTVPLNDVQEIRRFTQEEKNDIIRTNGSGGVFGYLGNFYHPKIGDIKMCATDIGKCC